MPCNYFVQLSGSSGWIEVLNGISEYGSPSFGILDGRILPDVQRAFPAGKFLDGTMVKHGVWDRNTYEPAPPEIRDSQAFLRRERQAFYSLQRQASAGHMQYSEMQVFISSLTDFLWGNLIQSKAQCGIITEAPHTLGGLILAGLAEALELPILHFQQSSITSSVRPRLGPDYSAVPWLLEDSRAEREIRRSRLEAEFDLIDRFIADARSGKLYSAEMDNQIKERETFRTFKGPWRRVFIPLSWLREESKVLAIASERKDRIPSTLAGLTPDNTSKSKDFLRSIFIASKQALQMRQMKSILREITSESFPPVFAVMFLHFEPEKTSMPDGGLYSDQLAAVRAVAKHLGERMTLVVKEHPSQLSFLNRGFCARSTAFYRELHAMPNVVVAPQETNRRELMESAQFIVTLTGTVALEASAVGSPVVALGHAWYSGLPGIFCCHGIHEVSRAIESALEFTFSDSESLADSLKNLLREEFILFRVNPSASRRFDSPEDLESMMRVCAAHLRESA